MNPQTIFILADISGGGRVFGLDQQTAIQIGIQLLNACILAFVLSKLLYNPVRDFMKKRTDRIQSQMDVAEEDMAKANELKLQYEKKVKDLELERYEILDLARKNAAEKGRLLLLDAKNEADSEKERALTEIQTEKERVRKEVKRSIIEVSSAMAAKFVSHTIDGDTQDKLFAETINELGETEWLDNNALDKIS